MTKAQAAMNLGTLIRDRREQILEVAARHYARRVRLIGSVARGDDHPGSDIDLLVDFGDGSSLFDLMHLSSELKDLLGRPVDVVSTGGLKARDAHILTEARDL